MPRPICEMIVGIKRDEHFGLSITFGSGGIFADLFDDYSLTLLPAGRNEILQKIMDLKIGKLLRGFRGKEGINMDRILDAIELLISFVEKSTPLIVELEINPLFIFEDKVVAIDALLARQI